MSCPVTWINQFLLIHISCSWNWSTQKNNVQSNWLIRVQVQSIEIKSVHEVLVVEAALCLYNQRKDETVEKNHHFFLSSLSSRLTFPPLINTDRVSQASESCSVEMRWEQVCFFVYLCDFTSISGKYTLLHFLQLSATFSKFLFQSAPPKK